MIDTAPAIESAVAFRQRTQRHLGRLDTVCFLIAAVVVLDTLGAVSLGGLETLTWLAVVSAAFLVPAGLVIAELGSTFPSAGGPYAWARRAFGRTAGAFVALAYWVEAAVWVGGSLAITAIAVVNEMVAPVNGNSRIVLALAFVWTAVVIAVIPLRFSKWLTAAGAFLQIALLAFFTGSVGLYALRNGVQSVALRDAAPSWHGFALVAPVIVYSFLGLELPSTASEEMRSPQRDVPAALAKSGAMITLLYCVPVLAILLVVPEATRSGLTGFIDALSNVFAVYGEAGRFVGGLAGVAFVVVLMANGLTWLIGSTRAAAAACQDGAGPEWFSAISPSTGTPLRATLAAGTVATLTSTAAFVVAGNDNAKYFTVVLTLSIVLLAAGNLLVFPALVKLRRTDPNLPRPFRVPGGALGVWLASGLTTAWLLLAIVAVLWPGLGADDPAAHLPEGFTHNRFGFLLVALIPLAAFVGTALAFSFFGARRPGRTAAVELLDPSASTTS